MSYLSLMKKYLSIFIATILLLASCSTEKTQNELFEETQSGSVLIYAKYYYELTLPNNETIYFTGLDDEGKMENVASELSELGDNCPRMSGTGFFVDDKGSILTNRHVVNPSIDTSELMKGYRKLLKSLAIYYSMLGARLSEEYRQLEAQKNRCTFWNGFGWYTDYDKVNSIENKQKELLASYRQIEELISDIRSINDPNSLKLKSVCQLGISYNNTYISGEKDLLEKNPCEIVRVSDIEDVDLALIQLKSKETPEGAYIFATSDRSEKSFFEKLSSKDNDDKLVMGQELYMIGYNAGPVLANTKKGIKVQMTSGKVTQLSDGQRILYDIATVSGSSGSPIIDTKGYLVAVNFAKLNGSDNFNFGIPLERIKEFMNW